MKSSSNYFHYIFQYIAFSYNKKYMYNCTYIPKYNTIEQELKFAKLSMVFYLLRTKVLRNISFNKKKLL